MCSENALGTENIVSNCQVFVYEGRIVAILRGRKKKQWVLWKWESKKQYHVEPKIYRKREYDCWLRGGKET